MAFPSDQKKEEVEFTNPRSFLGEISPTYWWCRGTQRPWGEERIMGKKKEDTHNHWK